MHTKHAQALNNQSTNKIHTLKCFPKSLNIFKGKPPTNAMFSLFLSTIKRRIFQPAEQSFYLLNVPEFRAILGSTSNRRCYSRKFYHLPLERRTLQILSSSVTGLKVT